MTENFDKQLSERENDTLFEKRFFLADKGQEPMRIDKWVQARIEGMTRNHLQQFINRQFLKVNDQYVKSNYKVKPGDRMELLVPVNPEYSVLKPEDMPLNIVYEDEDVMVINKPAGMVVHPGVGNHSGTLLNGIAFHFLKQNPQLTEEDLPRFGLVHRIDKNTTGLLVIGKTLEAATSLAQQFFNHTVKRQYAAVVWGEFEEDQGTIEVNIGRDLNKRKIFAPFPEADQGKHAVTHYEVQERFHYVTLIKCRLETGRTHQIRVHMKYRGHTLFNDFEYGGDKILKGTVYNKYKQFVENCFEQCPRCALHAQTLGFIHPTSGKELFFTAPIPPDMQGLIDKWRNYMNGSSVTL